MNKPAKVATAILPTPLHKLERLTNDIGKAEIYIKRDDLTGYGFGGNKLRKLDYIIKKAMDEGYTAVLTFGGNQTNHGRLTAAACAKFGLKSIILTSGKPPEDMSGNLAIDRILGCEVCFFDIARMIPEFEGKTEEEKVEIYMNFRGSCVDSIKERYAKGGDKVYVLAVGGHTEEGILGYFDCAEEIMAQEKELGVEFDYVVTGNGTGGTYMGLLLGAKYYGAKFKVIASNIAAKDDKEMQGQIDIANRTAEKFDIDARLSKEDIFIASNDYTGIGYNVPDEETRKVIYRMARLEGVMVDPTYTGKVAMAMIDMIEKEVIEKDAKVLFIHTGGTPALFTSCHLKAFEEELWKDIEVFTY